MYNNSTVWNKTAVNYTYGDANWGDLLTGYDGEGISYDANGNPLSYYNGKRYTFSWLYGRRLASIVVDGKTTTYTYNTEGLRLTKTASGVVHTYYRDGSTLLLERWGNSYLNFIYDESGAPLRMEYYNGSTTTVYYYVLNLQGDVLEIRDKSNNVVCRYSYDAWGKLLSVKDGSGNSIASATHIGILNPLRYRGYYYDTETGLYYLQSRYYDPQVGRFISADAVDVILATPIGLTDKNLYSYCDNNPVTREDENGEFWGIVAKFVIGVASQYVSDVVENITSGKKGWDILKPTSSAGEYLASGVTAIIPSSGVASTIVKNVVNEGIVCAEKMIKGDDIDVGASLFTITMGTILDTGANKISHTISKKIKSFEPKNYSSYAGVLYDKNPNITRDVIYSKMRTKTRLLGIADDTSGIAIDFLRNRLPY